MRMLLAALVAALVALVLAGSAGARLERHSRESVDAFHARLYHHGVTWERWSLRHRPLYRSRRRWRLALRDARWLQRRYHPLAPMRSAVASWYGPGFYGHGTACGLTLTTGLVGVAHRWLACGTRLEVCYAGRCSLAVVVDRGPFVYGRTFDLTGALAWRLHFGGVGTVSYRLL